MHSPGRSELVLGLLLMIPGSIAALLVDDLPVKMLFDPRTIADSIVGAIFLGVWGGLEHGIPWFGLALLHILYYVGVVAVIISAVSIVRNC